MTNAAKIINGDLAIQVIKTFSLNCDTDLRDTQITELPDNMSVGGFLDLEGTQITELPDNLSVGDALDLRGIQITELPDNLSVGGKILR